MYVVIGLMGGILEDVMLYTDKGKALDYIESQLDSYGIDPESFNREDSEGYWTDNPDMNENELFLRYEEIQE